MTDHPPPGLAAFLDAAGWGDAAIEPLAGDASLRRYFRLRLGALSAMLMYAPPPAEDPRPFAHAARWLAGNGLRAPRILAEAAPQGLILLEDFGEARMREFLDAEPEAEQAAYGAAVATLIGLHRLPPGPFAEYSLAEYLREALLFTRWYCPARGLAVDEPGYIAAWEQVLGELLPRQRPGVTVLRDYHSENIMLLDGADQQGLLDFQDALVGHPAYDLVSLLQDARREVSPRLEALMLELYQVQTGTGGQFVADYARLGAQRNAKIIGIFVRLWRRDGKPRYLDYLPRVWAALTRDLAHPALEPVRRWFAENIPQALRQAGGGTWRL